MANYCVYKPNKGQTLFTELKKEFGYKTARSIFLRAINPKFINDYKNTLSLDAEGVPTFNSLMHNKYMKKFIGDKKISDILTAKYPPVENTISNYGNQLEIAYAFNTKDDYSNDYVATVEQLEDKLQVVISARTKEKEEEFNIY